MTCRSEPFGNFDAFLTLPAAAAVAAGSGDRPGAGLAVPKAQIHAAPGGRGHDAEGKAEFKLAVDAGGGIPDPVEWEGAVLTVEAKAEVGGIRQEFTVSSGSRVEPVKVDAVTREAMQATGYERLSDVLSEIPGVVTRHRRAAGGGAVRRLPMVVGRGIKSGNVNLNRQSVGRLERVEVVKGAASALYGSDAIGGVVNMFRGSRRAGCRAA